MERVKTVLKSGGVIAVPTDTIYGVACLACNKNSLDKIYKIKGRNSAKPLAISVGRPEDLEKFFEFFFYNFCLGLYITQNNNKMVKCNFGSKKSRNTFTRSGNSSIRT